MYGGSGFCCDDHVDGTRRDAPEITGIDGESVLSTRAIPFIYDRGPLGSRARTRYFFYIGSWTLQDWI